MAQHADHDSANEGAAGIARRIDHLGRVVLPKEYRKVFGIRDGDLLDMTLAGDSIVVRKLERTCVFCASHDQLTTFREKLVCLPCIEALRSPP